MLPMIPRTKTAALLLLLFPLSIVTEENCAICPDGSDVPNPMREIFFGVKCGYLDDLTGEKCFTRQWMSMSACGCPYVPPDNVECALCADGSLIVDPSKVVGETYNFALDCGVAEWLAAGNTENAKCADYQSTLGAACNCPYEYLPKPACHPVCSDGLKFDLDKIVNYFLLPGYDEWEQVPCAYPLFYLSKNSTLCDDNKDRLSELCCVDAAENPLKDPSSPTKSPKSVATHSNILAPAILFFIAVAGPVLS